MLPTKFQFICSSGFRGEDFLEINQFSDWLISQKSSPLKPPGQMNQNFVGSILGRSSIKIVHLVPIL
jgi:hypothetical protein